jgi:hypothetical protein
VFEGILKVTTATKNETKSLRMSIYIWKSSSSKGIKGTTKLDSTIDTKFEQSKDTNVKPKEIFSKGSIIYRVNGTLDLHSQQPLLVLEETPQQNFLQTDHLIV